MQVQNIPVYWLITIIAGIPPTLGWRTFYISPNSSNVQIECLINHCYSLQDVIDNPSYFFSSTTILELLSGRYNITEKIGHMVIGQVQDFSVIGRNVTIHCDSNTTFGITVIGSSNVTIRGVEIIHCSAALMDQLQLQVLQILTENMYIFRHNIHPYFQQWLNKPFSCDSDHIILPCIATIFFCNNSNVALQETTILYSQHIGFLSIKNSVTVIISSLMAYNNINCIIYYVNTKAFDSIMDIINGDDDDNSGCTISDSQFLFGQANYASDSLASGLNLFLYDPYIAHFYIHVEYTSFVNNRGQHGNFFFIIYASLSFMELDIVIKHLSVEVSYDNSFPGLVIHDYGTFLDEHSIASISVVESVLMGSCVVIVGDPRSDDHTFEIIGMGIYKSRCSVAMNIADVKSYLKNINILDSHRNILQATKGFLKFEGNINFYRNQGAFSVMRGNITFDKQSIVTFANNSAVQQHFYTMQCFIL